jgi:hypothetical protein
LFFAGCATPGDDPFERDVQSGVDRTPGPVALPVCHGYGCAWRDYVTLSESEWQEVRAGMAPPAANAAAERMQIADTIGLIERIVGAKLGTAEDRAGTPFNWGDPKQLDCVDESINTSTYLHLLGNAGLLRYHTVRDPRRRTGFLRLSQHYTAVIEDNRTRRQYAIDSWFNENGQPAEVVELDRWLAGWSPGDDTRAAAR